MIAPLQGIRVVEVANWMAAPGAAAILADLGAEVIKVEPLGGDPMRGATRLPKRPEGAAPIDASFQMDNRGKRGIAVALTSPTASRSSAGSWRRRTCSSPTCSRSASSGSASTPTR